MQRERKRSTKTNKIDLKDFTVYHKEKTTTTIGGTSNLTSVTSHVPCQSEEFREDPLKKFLNRAICHITFCKMSDLR